MVLCPVAATHHITTTIHGACQALLLLLSTAANALATALQIDGTPLPDFADLAGGTVAAVAAVVAAAVAAVAAAAAAA